MYLEQGWLRLASNTLGISLAGIVRLIMADSIKSVYLSARFERRDELNSYRLELAKHGIEVTSNWLVNATPELSHEGWQRLAEIDKEDVRRADAFVLFTEIGGGGGARHVEYGMALALDKVLFVVGEVENLFQRLPQVTVARDWQEAMKALVKN